MKIALISDSLPPMSTGQGLLIYRMFEDLEPQGYCLISSVPAHSENGDGGYTHKLRGNYYQLPEGGRQLTRGYRFGLSLVRERVNLLLNVLHQARQIQKIIIKEECDVVVAFTGDVRHLPAGLLASRRAKLPFVAFCVDHYLYREVETAAKTFIARLLEPFLMRGANKVIVLNEALRDDLRKRFRIEAAVIYNSFDLSTYEHSPEPLRADSEIKIVFTGNVYQAHYDAFRNLMKAIELMGRDDIKLHLYTPQPPEELARRGISGPIVFHQPLALEDMPRVQKEADILFLPLAFDSPYPGVVRTSQPTKMGEYLAARRPVLLHAPPDSYISWYFRRYDCGIVVDEIDPTKLAEGILRILSDADLRTSLSQKAWERAKADFNLGNAKARFMEVLKRERKEA